MTTVTLRNPLMLGSQYLSAGVMVEVSEEQAAQWEAEGHIVTEAAAEAAAAAKSGKKKAEA